jgi:hypothetical protein
MRFIAEPSEAVLDRVAEQADPELVLEIGRDGAIRGVLEAYELRHGRAQIALSVEDASQGHGLGHTLFDEGL